MLTRDVVAEIVAKVFVAVLLLLLLQWLMVLLLSLLLLMFMFSTTEQVLDLDTNQEESALGMTIN
jgi:hypothetical protein